MTPNAISVASSSAGVSDELPNLCRVDNIPGESTITAPENDAILVAQSVLPDGRQSPLKCLL
jgi:hypothetical protein